MSKIIDVIILTIGYTYIFIHGKEFIAAVKSAYEENHFKCTKTNECRKRCGQLCRHYGKCGMCCNDDCNDCVFGNHT